MKLLFAHERFGALAGAETNAWHTAAELKRRGHAVALLHGAGTGCGEAAWRDVFSPRFPLDPAEPAASARAAVQAFAPDVVYVHNLSIPDATASLLATGLPLVRMVHDHQLYCLRGCKYHYLSRHVCQRPLSPYCLFPCGAFLVRDRQPGGLPVRWVSYRERQRDLALHRRFARLLVASRYMQEELIRNAVDPSRIEIHAPVPPAADDAPPSTFGDRNLLVYAGQIARGKGVDVLLESLARVTAPFECVIIGDGHHRAFCERLCRQLGLAGRVRFTGYLPQAQIREYYRDASVALMSSLWPEPFGAVGLEAMRYGLPVVAFDAGAIKEWLHDGENGLLVPWMDRAAFAAGVERLLRDKALARHLGARGRQLAAQRHDFAGYIDGLENLFLRVRAAGPVPAAA